MENGTFWDEIGASLQSIGLQAATSAAQSAANKITGKISGSSEVKQDPNAIVANPWNGGLSNMSSMQIAGVSLPIVLAGLAVIYFAVRK